jgi:O-antigen/teichoic acid export membrane protein
LNTALTGVIAGIGFITMYFFVIPAFLPDYSNGRDAMAIMFLSALVLPFGQSLGDLQNVIGMHNLYLRNMSLGFVLNLVIGIGLLKTTSLGINGVAIGTVSGLTAFSVAQYISYKNHILKNLVS